MVSCGLRFCNFCSNRFERMSSLKTSMRGSRFVRSHVKKLGKITVCVKLVSVDTTRHVKCNIYKHERL